MRLQSFFNLFFIFLGPLALVAQSTPQGLNYQTVVRDIETGAPVANQPVALIFNVYTGSQTGSIVYQENFETSTNEFGLINHVIGQGTPQIGQFSNIDWGGGAKFLEVLLVEDGQFQNLGRSRLWSVPYALYAANGGGGGSSWLVGNGPPPDNQGADSDLFLNSNNGDFYQKANESWIYRGTLSGPTGPQGPQGGAGPQGPAGKGISGTVDNGDGTFTLNFTDGTSFTTSDLTGPQGPKGEDGSGSGSGTMWLTGSGIPQSSEGSNGDLYFQTTGDFYQKIDGSWQQQGRIDGNPDDDITFNDIASGEVTGSFDNLQVSSLLGRPIGGMPPTGGQPYFMVLDPGTDEWRAGQLGGDVTGSFDNLQVSSLLGRPIGGMPPTGGQPYFMVLDPGTDEWRAGQLGGDISGSFDNLQVNILGRPIGGMPPTGGQAFSLVYDDSKEMWMAAPLQGEVGGNWNSLEIKLPLEKSADLSSSMIQLENDSGPGIVATSRESHGLRGTSAIQNGSLTVPDDLDPETLASGVLGEGVASGSNNGVGIWGRAVTASNGSGIGGILEGGAVGGLAITRQSNGIGFWALGSNNGQTALRATARGADLAGFFEGDVSISDDLEVADEFNAGSKNFKIDHPLAPRDKYLYHSTVESPERKTLYDGIVTTDADGYATVQLPPYFEALNKDYRYHLTVIGSFAQAIIAEKIQNNQFLIQTDQPGIEVSWQVTGIRNDAYARNNPLEVEVEKEKEKRGTYLHPKAFGILATMQTPSELQDGKLPINIEASGSSNKQNQ